MRVARDSATQTISVGLNPTNIYLAGKLIKTQGRVGSDGPAGLGAGELGGRAAELSSSTMLIRRQACQITAAQHRNAERLKKCFP